MTPQVRARAGARIRARCQWTRASSAPLFTPVPPPPLLAASYTVATVFPLSWIVKDQRMSDQIRRYTQQYTLILRVASRVLSAMMQLKVRNLLTRGLRFNGAFVKKNLQTPPDMTVSAVLVCTNSKRGSIKDLDAQTVWDDIFVPAGYAPIELLQGIGVSLRKAALIWLTNLTNHYTMNFKNFLARHVSQRLREVLHGDCPARLRNAVVAAFISGATVFDARSAISRLTAAEQVVVQGLLAAERLALHVPVGVICNPAWLEENPDYVACFYYHILHLNDIRVAAAAAAAAQAAAAPNVAQQGEPGS